jgi:hypothetical protein
MIKIEWTGRGRDRGFVPPDPEGTRSPLGEGVNPAEAHASFTTMNMEARDQSQTSDTGWEWAHLDMTHNHDSPFLGGAMSLTAPGTVKWGVATG